MTVKLLSIIIWPQTATEIVSIFIGFALQFNTNHAHKKLSSFCEKLIEFCFKPTYTRHVETVQEFGFMTSMSKIFEHIQYFISIGILGVRGNERVTP